MANVPSLVFGGSPGAKYFPLKVACLLGMHHTDGPPPHSLADDRFYELWAGMSGHGRGKPVRIEVVSETGGGELPDAPEPWDHLSKDVQRDEVEFENNAAQIKHHFRYLPGRLRHRIRLDEYSKIMNTPPMCAMYIRTLTFTHVSVKPAALSVSDCTAGVGGNSMVFSQVAGRVVAVEYDKTRVGMLASNAEVILPFFGRPAQTLTCVYADSTKRLAALDQCDVIIFGPSFDLEAFYNKEHVQDVEMGLEGDRVTLVALSLRKFAECPRLRMTVMHVPSYPSLQKVASEVGAGFVVRMHIHSAIARHFKQFLRRGVLPTLEKRRLWQGAPTWKASLGAAMLGAAADARHEYEQDILLSLSRKERGPTEYALTRGGVLADGARMLYEEHEKLLEEAEKHGEYEHASERDAERLTTSVHALHGDGGFYIQQTREALPGTKWTLARKAATQLQYASALLHFDMQYPVGFLDTDTGSTACEAESTAERLEQSAWEDFFAIWMTLPHSSPHVGFLQKKLAAHSERLPATSFVRTLLARLEGAADMLYEECACHFDPFRYEIDRAFDRLASDESLRTLIRGSSDLTSDCVGKLKYLNICDKVPGAHRFAAETAPYRRSTHRFYGPRETSHSI